MRMDHRDGPRTLWKLIGGWLPLTSNVRVQVTLGTQGPNQDPWYPGVRLYQEGHTKSYNFSRVKDVHRLVYACALSHSVVSNSLWPIDCSCYIQGILQARILKWVAIPFSRQSSWPRDRTWVFCIAGVFLLSEPPGKPIQDSESERESEIAQSCPILCDPMNCSLPGSSVHGIFQARVLEWGAISFSRGSSQPRDRTQVSWIADRHFTVWATREAQTYKIVPNCK